MTNPHFRATTGIAPLLKTHARPRTSPQTHRNQTNSSVCLRKRKQQPKRTNTQNVESHCFANALFTYSVGSTGPRVPPVPIRFPPTTGTPSYRYGISAPRAWKLWNYCNTYSGTVGPYYMEHTWTYTVYSCRYRWKPGKCLISNSPSPRFPISNCQLPISTPLPVLQ